MYNISTLYICIDSQNTLNGLEACSSTIITIPKVFIMLDVNVKNTVKRYDTVPSI